MSRDAEAKNLRLYDRRTIERNIKKGLITRKDYEKFLKALEDAKDKGVQGGDLTDDLDDDIDESDEQQDHSPDHVAAAPPPPSPGSNSNSH